jgi:hypothetical protein
MKFFALKDYHSFKKNVFATFIIQILNGLFQYVLIFATPPVTKEAYTEAVEAYNTASSNYSAGGKGFKAIYDGAYAILLEILDKLLAYVNDWLLWVS